MTTAYRFDLRALIRRVCNESAAADPTTIAKEVDNLTDDADLRAGYRQALRFAVHNTIVNDRRSPFPETPAVPLARTPDQATQPAQGRSWKLDGLRGLADELTKRYSYGFNRDDWKFLMDFNRANCQAAAVMRRKLAAGNIREAEKFERVERLLVEHAAATIKDLPLPVQAQVRALFGGAR